jgi:hypothetical protein
MRKMATSRRYVDMSANINKTLDLNWQGKFIYYEKKRFSRIRKISPLNITICFEYWKRVWCIFHAPVPRNFYKSLVRTSLHDTFSTFSGQNKNTNDKKKLSRQAYCFVGNEVQNCLLFIIFRRNERTSTAGFNSLLCSVLTTEYTQSGNRRSLAYIPSWLKISPGRWAWGVDVHPLSL